VAFLSLLSDLLRCERLENIILGRIGVENINGLMDIIGKKLQYTIHLLMEILNMVPQVDYFDVRLLVAVGMPVRMVAHVTYVVQISRLM